MIIQILLIAAVFLAAIVAGIVLRKMTKEELRDGRKYFLSLIIASLALILIITFINFDVKLKLAYFFSLMIIFVVSWLSLN